MDSSVLIKTEQIQPHELGAIAKIFISLLPKDLLHGLSLQEIKWSGSVDGITTGRKFQNSKGEFEDIS